MTADVVIAAVRSTLRLVPSGRPAKSTTSIIEKLRRETIRLSQMQDIAGCRLVVRNVKAQDKVVEALGKRLPGATIVDRRRHPSHEYRAVHIVAVNANKPVEIQIRTGLQHLWAELSEKLSDVIDPGIKYGKGDPRALTFLSETAQLVAGVENLEAAKSTREMRNRVTSLKTRVRVLLKANIQLAEQLRREGRRDFPY